MADFEIQRDVPLAPLTTLELGGPARFFARVVGTDTLVEALRWGRERGVPVAVLGGGSNLIVPDEGYEGLVVHIAIGDIAFHADGRVEVGAGVPWEVVVDGAVTRGWAGLECLTGIPGSTGATAIQNVGAYGQDVAEVIESVVAIRRDTLELEELTPTACDFGYRDSMFKRHPDRYIVSGVRFALRPDGPGTVRYTELEERVVPGASLSEIRNAILDLRRKKSMVIDPDDPNRCSAGSFFLNPVVSSAEADRVAAFAVSEGLAPDLGAVPRYPTPSGKVKLAAGWLVEKSGIAKGTRRGAVGVSSNHALALVHHGGGTTTELLAFADEIRSRVEERFGVCLKREPRLLGDSVGVVG
jgi:UDP-N-acetylmuramate dehydrogenase